MGATEEFGLSFKNVQGRSLAGADLQIQRRHILLYTVIEGVLCLS